VCGLGGKVAGVRGYWLLRYSLAPQSGEKRGIACPTTANREKITNRKVITSNNSIQRFQSPAKRFKQQKKIDGTKILRLTKNELILKGLIG